MTGLFSWVNYLDAAVLDCADQSGSLPVQNLAADSLEQIFRTTATATAITADLLSSQANKVFGIFGATLAPTDTIRVRLSDVSIGAGDVYDSTALASNVADGYGQYILVLPDGTATARYLQVDISAPSRVDKGGFDIGRMWIGNSWEPGIGFSYGWSDSFVDPSTVIRAKHSNRLFVSTIPIYRTRKITFDWLSDADKDQLMDMLRTVGIRSQILFVPDVAGDLIKKPIFGRLAQVPEVTQAQAVIPPAYSVPFVINEDN